MYGFGSGQNEEARLLGRVFASRWAELADVTDLSHENALVHM